MKVELESQGHIVSSRMYEAAEKQVFFLIELHSSGFTSLIKRICEAAEIIPFVLAYTQFNAISCPELFERLLNVDDNLAIAAAALETIESDSVRAKVALQELMLIVNHLRAMLAIAGDLLKSDTKRTRITTQVNVIEKTKAEVARMASRAGRVASVSRCGQCASAIAHAQMRAVKSLEDCHSRNQLLIAKIVQSRSRSRAAGATLENE